MSEELQKRGLTKHGIRIGNYEYYNIGETTLNILKNFKIIPEKNYGKYKSRKPDGLLVDRRNKKNIRVICVIEHKNTPKLTSNTNIKKACQQCNDLCQVLDSEIGVITDSTKYFWINPKQDIKSNEYQDETTSQKRSYSFIKDENDNPLQSTFITSAQGYCDL